MKIITTEAFVKNWKSWVHERKGSHMAVLLCCNDIYFTGETWHQKFLTELRLYCQVDRIPWQNNVGNRRFPFVFIVLRPAFSSNIASQGALFAPESCPCCSRSCNRVPAWPATAGFSRRNGHARACGSRKSCG